MTVSHTNVACEGCGKETEATAGWSKPSGTAGSAGGFVQPVQRADHVLGHSGHLCTKCWWERVIAGRVAA